MVVVVVVVVVVIVVNRHNAGLLRGHLLAYFGGFSLAPCDGKCLSKAGGCFLFKNVPPFRPPLLCFGVAAFFAFFCFLCCC